MIFSWSLPRFVAMTSSFLNLIFGIWEKSFIFFQEMPACAVDDAVFPVSNAFFTLRFRVCLEQFKQFDVSNTLPTSWNISLTSYWTGLRFCCRSRWRACRWGSRSSSQVHKFTNTIVCFKADCDNPGILKSMSTSFHIDWSWLDSSRFTTGCPVLSFFTVSTLKERVSISCKRDDSLAHYVTANNWFLRVIMIWIWFRLVWLGNFGCCTSFPFRCRAVTEPKSLILSCFPEIFRGGRADAKTFLYTISPVSIRTIFGKHQTSWECFVNIVIVRSCFIEFQFFSQSKVDVDPITLYLMFLPCFYMFVRDVVLISRSCQERILTDCLLLNFWHPGINLELTICTLIAHPTFVWNQDIVL